MPQNVREIDMRLLDTDIMVDILRGFEPAVEWLGSLEEIPGLLGFVVMELINGCNNKQEMNQLIKQVEPFNIYWPTERDANRALSTFSRTRLSHGLDILDVMIGECAVGIGATLCTFNVKHFQAITDLETERPYDKIH